MVRRGTERAMVVCDMPFLSYQISPEDALRNCGRAMKENGVQRREDRGRSADGGDGAAARRHRHPRHGHLGLNAAIVHALGGYRVQGRDDAEADGSRPTPRRSRTRARSPWCWSRARATRLPDHQGALDPDHRHWSRTGVRRPGLVLHDMLGLNDQFSAKFVKKYGSVG